MKIPVLGIGFDALTLSQAAEAAEKMITEHRGGTVVTANPEILLRCRDDREYAAAVNGADLVLPDGIGCIYASRILGTPLPERVTGADLTPLLLTGLAQRGGSVFLYGGKPGVAERAAFNLRRKEPRLRIAGTENGYISSEDGLLRRLEETKPDLLLLGLGAPRQELWMRDHRDLPCVMIGVGGLLDVFAGDVTRAPELWQKAGTEWLYRLLRQPWRFRRMVRLPGVLLLAAEDRLRIKKRPPKGPGNAPE